MQDPSKLSDEGLRDAFKHLYHTVYVVGSYCLDDLVRLRELRREIEDRGMTVRETVEVNQ